MISMDTSSTGSPFSIQSTTDPSSPENNAAGSGSSSGLTPDSYTQALQAQAVLLKNGYGGMFGTGVGVAGQKGMRAGSPLKEVQVKVEPGSSVSPR